jgi:hypothetical protein
MEPWQIILALLIAAGLFVVISRVRKAVPKEPQPVKPKPKATSSRFEVQDDWEAVHDQIVADSQKIWPIVRKMPLFYALSFITVLSIALNFIGAYSLTSSINGLGMAVMFGVVIWSMFTVADVVVPTLSMATDKGKGAWYEFRETDRSIPATAAIYICGALQLFVIFVSTSETANVTNAANQIGATAFQSRTSRIETINKNLAALPAEPQPYAQLKRTADEAEKKAMIESYRSRSSRTVPADPTEWGPHCGPQCLRDKEAVRVLRERQAVAKSREDLLAERATLQGELDDSGTARVRDAQWAYNLEHIGVPADVSKTFGVMWIGWAIYIVGFIGWQKLADTVGNRRREEYERIASRMDRERESTFNKPAKYLTIGEFEEELPMIEGPTDRVEIHHINADELRRRFANDEFIVEIYELFGTMLEPLEGEAISIDEVHRRYKIDAMKANPNTPRYAMRNAFNDALGKIILVRDDIKLSSGAILGWSFAADAKTEPAQEAAE